MKSGAGICLHSLYQLLPVRVTSLDKPNYPILKLIGLLLQGTQTGSARYFVEDFKQSNITTEQSANSASLVTFSDTRNESTN